MNIDILTKILEIDSPSNNENKMIEYIKNTHSGNNFQILNDLSSNTNLVYHLNNDKKETVLLDAHVDEIGTRIKTITKDGFLLVKAIGLPAENLRGRPAKIYASKINKIIKGVFLIDPVHLRGARKKYGDKLNEHLLYVDIGLNSKQEVLKMVEIGDFVLPDYQWFQPNPNVIVSKSLDNKLSVFILLKLLQYFEQHPQKCRYNLILNFSSREEIGNTPYLGYEKHLNIDKIIILDTIFAFDVPFINKDIYGNITLGKGPVLERGGSNHGLYHELSKFADIKKIPYQTYLAESGGSNLSYFSRYSSLTQFIGIPCRNLHSPVEMTKISDIQKTFHLVKKYLSKN